MGALANAGVLVMESFKLYFEPLPSEEYFKKLARQMKKRRK